MHPRVVSAFVLVSAINREGHRVSGGLIHVPRVKATCPSRHAGGGHGVGNRVVTGPSDRTAFRDRYVDGGIVEALRAADTVRD